MTEWHERPDVDLVMELAGDEVSGMEDDLQAAEQDLFPEPATETAICVCQALAGSAGWEAWTEVARVRGELDAAVSELETLERVGPEQYEAWELDREIELAQGEQARLEEFLSSESVYILAFPDQVKVGYTALDPAWQRPAQVAMAALAKGRVSQADLRGMRVWTTPGGRGVESLICRLLGGEADRQEWISRDAAVDEFIAHIEDCEFWEEVAFSGA